jgi:hypothetical protein
MKFNKWTLGLAAIGAVSLTSAARADEKPNYLQTSVATTTLSGYVDTSIEWDPGTGNQVVPGYSYNAGKQDGFNLNSVVVTLAKAEDETEWAAGYNVDFMYGPDNPLANTSLGYGSIRQAYVTLRTPVGNGIDWKLGVFDTIIGYESTVDPSNPNYSRSYGYTIEPTSHTGFTGTYKVNDSVSITAGLANTSVSAINGRANPPKAESYKSFLADVSLTAPTNWGSLSGSALYAGFITGWNANLPANTAVGGVPATYAASGGVQQNLYIGTTINTPMSELKVGASYDYVGVQKQTYSSTVVSNTAGTAFIPEAWANAADLYATFQATEKMSFNTRAEFFWESRTSSSAPITGSFPNALEPSKVFALTETVQYDLWKNVLSRLEVRWDHQAGSLVGGGQGGAWGGNAYNPASQVTKRNWYDVVANVIYKF